MLGKSSGPVYSTVYDGHTSLELHTGKQRSTIACITEGSLLQLKFENPNSSFSIKESQLEGEIAERGQILLDFTRKVSFVPS